jgi:hypothetical protein
MNESKKRILKPNKLTPPPEVIQRIMEKDTRIMPNNPVLKFFRIFFGEGF